MLWAAAEQSAPSSEPYATGKVAMVHKKDAEGSIEIDAQTGWVLTSKDERPEWAEHLVIAHLAERHQYYTNRLGKQYSGEHKNPDVFAYEDLAWSTVKDIAVEGQEGEETGLIDADAEFRMDVLAAVLGIDREEGTIENVLAEGEISMDQYRSDEEAALLEESQRQAPKAVNE
jgi:hypothetical protein